MEGEAYEKGNLLQLQITAIDKAETTLKSIFKHTPDTDDVMFGLVMSQLEICRKFLKAVLPQHDFTKLKIVDQSHLKTDYLSKAGRLDIHCTDAYGNQFDIELQMTNEHNVAQRAKYYHALMTNHMLTAGENYQNLKETYVIFLCPFNPPGYRATASSWALSDDF